MADVKKQKTDSKPHKDHHKHHKKPEIVTFKTHLTTLAKICCVVYCYTIVKLCFAKEGFDFFTWHPFFMTIGYMLLTTTGFYILNKNNTYLRKKTKSTLRIQAHFYIISTGFILAAIGIFTIYKNKEYLGKQHFSSWHGTFGITAFLSTLYPMLNGIILHWKKELAKYIYSVKILKYGHISAGCFSYTCTILALVLATYTEWFEKRSSGSIFIFYLVLVTMGFSVLWALHTPLEKVYYVVTDQVKQFFEMTKEE